MAPPTTKSPTIITTMELEKPESACSGLKIPNIIRQSREHSATRSERILPWTNKTADTPRMRSVVNIAKTAGVKKWQGRISNMTGMSCR